MLHPPGPYPSEPYTFLALAPAAAVWLSGGKKRRKTATMCGGRVARGSLLLGGGLTPFLAIIFFGHLLMVKNWGDISPYTVVNLWLVFHTSITSLPSLDLDQEPET